MFIVASSDTGSSEKLPTMAFKSKSKMDEHDQQFSIYPNLQSTPPNVKDTLNNVVLTVLESGDAARTPDERNKCGKVNRLPLGERNVKDNSESDLFLSPFRNMNDMSEFLSVAGVDMILSPGTLGTLTPVVKEKENKENDFNLAYQQIMVDTEGSAAQGTIIVFNVFLSLFLN